MFDRRQVILIPAVFSCAQDLRRELSRRSSLYRTKTGHKDVEKEGSEDSEDFDLLAYLRDEADQYDAAGFKRKVVGVSWDKLNVTGAGGMKVCSLVIRSLVSRELTSFCGR